jgi:ferrous iron transport protein A
MTVLHRLSSLAAGQTATVHALHVDGGFQFHLHALGFRTGKTLQVIRSAPFNGPLQLRLGNTDVMLRQQDAYNIKVFL